MAINSESLSVNNFGVGIVIQNTTDFAIDIKVVHPVY